ncbi:MAG TPA: outer membrane lipid asymmetry maintenance protein MlaD [Gammaproteobacteria bacterium]|nr:outer membrane lipid asymmetry maintenance protein MlaD [Gammaproteobacteria bacterium]
MKKTRTIEIMVGLFVVAGIAALFMLAMKVSNLNTMGPREGYTLSARFDNIGGLKVMSAVRAGGVLVGRVTDIDYDQQTYEALVRMRIFPRYDRFPTDTTASIFTAGLLGEQYISLEPGSEEDYLGDGGEIRLTQSALILEQVVGKFFYSQASK